MLAKGVHLILDQAYHITNVALCYESDQQLLHRNLIVVITRNTDVIDRYLRRQMLLRRVIWCISTLYSVWSCQWTQASSIELLTPIKSPLVQYHVISFPDKTGRNVSYISQIVLMRLITWWNIFITNLVPFRICLMWLGWWFISHE